MNALSHLVTTPQPPPKLLRATEREAAEVEEFFKPARNKGAQFIRFDSYKSLSDAQTVLRRVIQRWSDGSDGFSMGYLVYGILSLNVLLPILFVCCLFEPRVYLAIGRRCWTFFVISHVALTLLLCQCMDKDLSVITYVKQYVSAQP